MDSNSELARTTISAPIERVTIVTKLTYEALVTAFEQELGRLDPSVNQSLVKRKAPWVEVEQELGEIAGERGLMVIFRANQGAITSLSGKTKRCSLFLVGNPLIAAQILDIDSRASLYVPFRVCLYDDGQNASIAYDRPSSSLAALGRPELAKFGALLDDKIDTVARSLAQSPPSEQPG